MTDEGAAGDVQSQVEDLAHKAVNLTGSAVDVPREAVGGVLGAVSRTMHALADFVDELQRNITGE
jgi:ABC-type transporter Mla subunit MlaD